MLILILCLSLFFSAFFSSMETAFTSLENVEIRMIKNKYGLLGKIAFFLYERMDTLISTILIGNNIANVIFSVVATQLTIQIWGNTFVAVMTGIVIFVMLIFGEITPKQLAFRYNVVLAVYSSWFLFVLYFLLLPFSKAFSFISYFVNLLHSKKDKTLSEGSYYEHLTELLLQMGGNKNIKANNTRRIRRALEISNKDVDSIMTHRKDVCSLSANKTINDAFTLITSTYYRNIPIYEEEDKEKIIGIIHVRQILHEKAKKHGTDPLYKTIKKFDKECSPLTLPQSLSIAQALPMFQNKKCSFAIVIDEFGGLAGVITLTDITRYILSPDLITKINNQSSDSSSKSTLYSSETIKPQKKQPKDYALFDVKAETQLSEIEELLSIKITPQPESHSIAGYLLEYTGGNFFSEANPKHINKIEHPLLGEFTITKKSHSKIISLSWKTKFPNTTH